MDHNITNDLKTDVITHIFNGPKNYFGNLKLNQVV